MEEWVGRQWHRFITRAADGPAQAEPVSLESMQRSIGLMFRAGGGAQSARIAPAGTTRVGGQRTLLQRMAGSGTHAVLGQWHSDVLALPPHIAVFAQAERNRQLYLWLAALAATEGEARRRCTLKLSGCRGGCMKARSSWPVRSRCSR